MKDRLLDATASACAEFGAPQVSVQHILDAAGVTRGTFYAHFVSIQEAIAAVAQRAIDHAQADNLSLYQDVTDPLFRIAVGPQLNLCRAALQPAWARIIIESRDLLYRSIFVRAIRQDVITNIRQKNFDRIDVQSAVDLHIGAMIQGARTMQRRKYNKLLYIQSVTINLLRAFGLPRVKAQEIVQFASADLNARAPLMFDWWDTLD